jgi:hypothetical protein
MAGSGRHRAEPPTRLSGTAGEIGRNLTTVEHHRLVRRNIFSESIILPEREYHSFKARIKARMPFLQSESITPSKRESKRECHSFKARIHSRATITAKSHHPSKAREHHPSRARRNPGCIPSCASSLPKIAMYNMYNMYNLRN